MTERGSQHSIMLVLLPKISCSTAAFQALPETCLEDIRQMGPLMVLDAAANLGAVLRRCNAVLSGTLGGVDAMGEKVGPREGIRRQYSPFLRGKSDVDAQYLSCSPTESMA